MKQLWWNNIDRIYMHSKCILMLLVFTTFLSCNFKKDEVPQIDSDNKTTTTNEITITDKEDAKDIITQVTSYSPIWCSLFVVEKKQYIIALVNKRVDAIENKDPFFISSPDIHVCILQKKDEDWSITKTASIHEDEFEYLTFYNNFEVATIEGLLYLYYQYRTSPMGNATSYQSVSFNLLSLDNYENYSASYGGTPFYSYGETECYIKNTESLLSENLKGKTQLKSFLDQKVNSCSIVALGIEREKDINHPDNYAEKWEADNKNRSNISGETALNITYYDSPIFLIDQLDEGNSIENEGFIIHAEFTGNVLGYNKTTKKYFPIWIDSCMRGCNKNITPEPGDSETYFYIENSMMEDQTCIRINLSEMTFLYSQKEHNE